MGRVPIRFGTYNIFNRLNRGLGSALTGTSQVKMYLVIFQETKVTDIIYTYGSSGYSAVITDAPSQHRGVVALFYWP